MRVLILGGSVFLSRSIVVQALSAEHEVLCATRGVTGTIPRGARHITVDRAVGLEPLDGETFDAVVDVSSNPEHVRAATRALAGRVGHWTYISSCSAYADQATPNQSAADAPLLDPTEEGYGNAKVACENAVRDSGVPALICRPGLIVGPGDSVPRFTYWPLRMTRGGEVLAPGAPDRLVQYIDVDDLSGWLLQSIEGGLTGVYDTTGPTMPFSELLMQIASGVGSRVRFTWVDQDFLLESGVEPWMGKRSLPLWLPTPEYAGFMTRDTTPARDAGLTVRSTAETARTTLDWWRGHPDEIPLAAGLDAQDEHDLLRAWHERTGTDRYGE
ncbi:MAG: NAD-dependent epimerase/dehydratase family protein [Longispora sp.]|nr:NAD-dependent epimerase/dehydratase family protein [Longispora sp. (in: high G+C Gram-positive bacteria)]